MKTKICSKCKQRKYLSKFHKNKRIKDGYHYYCKGCKAIHAHNNYLKHRESELRRSYLWRKTEKGKHSIRKSYIKMRSKYRKKYECRYTLNNAIKYGKIRKRNSCEICLNSPTHCHHEDYSKPFEFIELCTRCHMILHKQYDEKGIKIT